MGTTSRFIAAILVAIVTFAGIADSEAADKTIIYLTHPDAADGATLLNGRGESFRVYAIAPPHLARDCEDNQRVVDCETKSKAMLEHFASSFLTCQKMGEFAGTPAVRCRDNHGRDIGARMVKAGWAIPDRSVGHQYIFEEMEAEARGNGIWQRRVSSTD